METEMYFVSYQIFLARETGGVMVGTAPLVLAKGEKLTMERITRLQEEILESLGGHGKQYCHIVCMERIYG